MGRTFEYGMTLLLGVIFIYLVIVPVVHETAASLNRTADCIQSLKADDCGR